MSKINAFSRALNRKGKTRFFMDFQLVETKRNETDRNETKRNQTKRKDVTFRFVSIGFVRFRFVSISFRTLQVPSFDSGFSKNEILELIVFN